MGPLSEVRISTAALLHNFSLFKSNIGNAARLICVVKANAYGHGVAEVISVLKDHTDGFMVDDELEYHRIRPLTKRCIYLLGYVEPSNFINILEPNVVLALFSIEQIEGLRQASITHGIKAKVHLAIDAGFGREGTRLEDLPALLGALRAAPEIEVEAMYAHYSSSSDMNGDEVCKEQQRLFSEAIEITKQFNIPPVSLHIDGTYSTLLYRGLSSSRFQYARIGYGLYGGDTSSLKPVMQWVTKIAQIKRVKQGDTVGYSRTFKAEKKMIIGLIPQGYSDGLDRRSSNKGHVLVRGQRCRFLGRISMNMSVVDLTDVHGVMVGDEVIIIGQQGNEQITAHEIAMLEETIGYEVFTRVNPFLPRRII